MKQLSHYLVMVVNLRDAKGKFGFSDGNYVSHKDRK